MYKLVAVKNYGSSDFEGYPFGNIRHWIRFSFLEYKREYERKNMAVDEARFVSENIKNFGIGLDSSFWIEKLFHRNGREFLKESFFGRVVSISWCM